jgi:lysophospholipase L1-like esterase
MTLCGESAQRRAPQPLVETRNDNRGNPHGGPQGNRADDPLLGLRERFRPSSLKRGAQKKFCEGKIGTLAAWARSAKNVFTLHRSATIGRSNYRDVKIIRNIFAGVAVSLVAACGGGTTAVHPTQPTVVQQPPTLSNITAFMGDSITQFWDIPANDPAPTINFGVAGQTTPDMLARFNNDVIASAPGVVVILGGIDDIAQYANGVTTTPPDIESIKAMAAMAQAAGIKVILCSVMPTNYNSTSDPLLSTIPSTVVDFNQQLMALARASGYLYADYYDAMLAPDGTQNTALFTDAVHPNTAGYAVMWSVLAPLLQEDLPAP